jgi:hypothetical protein
MLIAFSLPCRFFYHLHKIRTALLFFPGSVAVIAVPAMSGASKIVTNYYIQYVLNLRANFTVLHFLISKNIAFRFRRNCSNRNKERAEESSNITMSVLGYILDCDV